MVKLPPYNSSEVESLHLSLPAGFSTAGPRLAWMWTSKQRWQTPYFLLMKKCDLTSWLHQCVDLWFLRWVVLLMRCLLHEMNVVHPSAVPTLRSMVPVLVFLSMTSLLSKRVERELLGWASNSLPPLTTVSLGAFAKQCSHHIHLTQSKWTAVHHLHRACQCWQDKLFWCASLSHCYFSMK